jgi:hypothetical protein
MERYWHQDVNYSIQSRYNPYRIELFSNAANRGSTVLQLAEITFAEVFEMEIIVPRNLKSIRESNTLP